MEAEERRAAFGTALARARKGRNISQAQLGAMLCGSTQSTVSSWEVGAAEPEPMTVFAIEEALGTEPGYLSRHLGYVPASPIERPTPPASDAIADDPRLSPFLRRLLLMMYAEATTETRPKLDTLSDE